MLLSLRRAKAMLARYELVSVIISDHSAPSKNVLLQAPPEFVDVPLVDELIAQNQVHLHDNERSMFLPTLREVPINLCLLGLVQTGSML